MQTVFLIDDDASVRLALSRVLKSHGFEVEAFDSAEAFLARPEPGRRGCVVLDVSMPGLTGLELQAELAAAGESLPIIFLSGNGDIPMSVRAIKRGAVDFLTKPVAGEVLVQTVRDALVQHAAAQRGDEEIAQLRERLATLTPREREVLAGLMEGKINKQIAAELGVVEQTVKYHRAHIMTRMNAKTVSELMRMAAKLELQRRSES